MFQLSFKTLSNIKLIIRKSKTKRIFERLN